MLDPYSVLGISQGADEETIKKAYRQKCKQYHPDLHPDDPTCEDKFKEVQAAYSEIMRQRQGGGNSGARDSGYGYGSSSSGQRTYQQNSQSSGYQDPFGFGFGFDPLRALATDIATPGSPPAGIPRKCRLPTTISATDTIRRRSTFWKASPPMSAAPAGMHYAALACAGPGNNIRAQSEARAAVEMEPGNYEYQNLLDRLQNPGRTYRTYQQAHTQPGGGNPLLRFCLTLWIAQMFFTLFRFCCIPC